jgi:hypothetical protein
MHACLLVREQPWYRRGSFEAGLRASGFSVDTRIRPSPDNILVIWNRYGNYDHIAKDYEKVGGRVLVAENGYLGREWNNGFWYAIARGQHNTQSEYQLGDEERVRQIGLAVEPWRTKGEEIVILETRGIGPTSVREPPGWARGVYQKLLQNTARPVRLRKHPGEGVCVPLYDDLKNAWAVITWGSGGALKALTWGIPVFHGYPRWIGAEAARAWNGNTEDCVRGDRSKTMQRVAWGMWSTSEIERGAPFTWLLR